VKKNSFHTTLTVSFTRTLDSAFPALGAGRHLFGYSTIPVVTSLDEARQDFRIDLLKAT
jgi:chorismate mutase